MLGLALAPPARATESPIAAYSFDENEGTTLHDDSGAHDGTIENGAEWTAGKFGSALRFDAEDDCVTIPDANDLDLGASFTMEAWVRPQQNRVWTPVISKDSSGEWFSYELFDHGEAGAPMGLTGQGTSTYTEAVGEDPPSPLLWSHLALTSDGEDLRLYLDGELLDTTTALTPQNSNKPLRLGCSETWGHFEGVIDEVRIYDRALNVEELTADRKTAIATPPSEDPIAAYSFDEGEGEVAHDAFGDHDGAVEGAEWVGGRYGGALRFNNENEEKVRIPGTDDLRLSGEFTLEAWVRPQFAMNWLPVITKEAGTQFGYQLYAGGEEAGAAEGYVAKRDWEYIGAAAPEAMPPRLWTHLALTCDGDHLRLYEDGVLVDSDDPCSAQAGEGDLLIGGNDVFGERFEGTIDEVRVYNRALGAEEITADRETAIETPPSENPIAAYSFDEGEGGSVQDSAGDHDGTVDGAQWVKSGEFGGALRFDGEDDLVEVADATDLQLSGDFTLEAWVKPRESHYWGPILNKETEGFVSYQLYAGGEIPGVAEGYVAQRDWEFATATAPAVMPAKAWTHLALICDGEHLRLYENGELADTGGACSAQQSDGPLTIGGNEAFGEHFEGVIDEVRIYGRALDVGRIEEDRHTPISLPAPDGPRPIETSNFEDVWCASSTSCVAVGDSDATGRDQSQVKRLVEGSWVTDALPAIKDAHLSSLGGVSCGAPDACLAVGSYIDPEDDTNGLAATWDGESWDAGPVVLPGAVGIELSDVDCVAVDDCVAVGRYTDVEEGARRALVASWDGDVWTQEGVSFPEGWSQTDLDAVSCWASSQCVAVGSYLDTGFEIESLAVVTESGGWNVEAVPEPAGSTLNRLAAVNCPPSSNPSLLECSAVGTYFNSKGVPKPLAAKRSSAGVWSLTETPNPVASLATELIAVDCASPGTCTAAGYYLDDTRTLPLTMALSGGTWTEQSVDTVDLGAIDFDLRGVSCPTSSTCRVVGSIVYGHGMPRREFSFGRSEGAWVADGTEPLERKWTRVEVSTVGSRLTDISCPNPSSLASCVSVGAVEAGASAEDVNQLASVGVGTDPSAQVTPPTPVGATSSALGAVDCATTTSCVAVGNYHDAEGRRNGLAMKWNGSSWTAAATPEPEGTIASYLNGVACSSSSDCVAVGGRLDAEGELSPLALHWNGSTWSVTSPASPGGFLEGELAAVSCSSSSDCAAVGEYVDAEGVPHPLAMHWSGSAWTTIAVGGAESGSPLGLTAVSCVAGECFAIGSYLGEDGSFGLYATVPSSTLAWDYAEVPLDEEAALSEVADLSCVSGSRCLAIGRSDIDQGREPWAIEWDGSLWAEREIDLGEIEYTPVLAVLAALDCVSSTVCGVAGASWPSSRGHKENLIAAAEWPEEGEIELEVDVGSPSAGSMEAVSCSELGKYLCVAIGSLSNPTAAHEYESAITSWVHAGNEWEENGQPTGIADVTGSTPEVADVSCSSSTACTAIGGEGGPMISRWNGTAWSKQSAPSVPAVDAQFTTGVSCPVASFCAAVGYYSDAGVDRPIAYRWVAGSWSLDLINESEGTPELLTDVSCVSAIDCVAVGHLEDRSEARIYRWDGSEWASEAAPAPVEAIALGLQGVSCTASSYCSAVGDFETSGSPSRHGLILRWNGAAWAQEGDGESVETKSYSAVSCYSRIGCVAVAETYGDDTAAVMGWDGSAWTSERTAIEGVGSSTEVSLNDVDCASASDCVVVGEIEGPGASPGPLVLEPFVDYAEGRLEDEEGGSASRAAMVRFSDTQEHQIEEVIAEDLLVQQKLGGTDYSARIGPWTFEQPDGSDYLAGAVVELTLDHAKTWTDFEEWPVVAFDRPVDPTSYGPGRIEIRGRRVKAVQLNLSLVTDAEGNVVSGSLAGIEPTTVGGGEYLFGPTVYLPEVPSQGDDE
jgi:hypothetical protein